MAIGRQELKLDELRSLIKDVYVEQMSKEDFEISYNDVTSMIDKIGLQYAVQTSSTDHLALFDSVVLPYGTTVEEYFIHDLEVKLFDPESTPFNKERAKVDVAYHVEQSAKKIELRVDRLQAEKSFLGAPEFSAFEVNLIARIQSTKNTYKYEAKKRALTQMLLRNAEGVVENSATVTVQQIIEGIGIVTNNEDVYPHTVGNRMLFGYIPPVTNEQSAREFVKNVKKVVEVMRFKSPNFNELGYLVEAKPSDLVLILKAGVLPEVATELLAQAFNKGELAYGVQTLVVDSFGGNDTSDDIAETLVGSTFAVLIHRDKIKYFETRNTTGIDRNFNALNDTLTHHFNETIMDIRALPMVAFTSKEI